jgi:hypothetical protein
MQSTADGTTGTTVDIHGDADTTILGTKLTIDASEKTSLQADTQPSVVSPTILDDSELSFYVDEVGSATRGIKIAIYGTIGAANTGVPTAPLSLSRTLGNSEITVSWSAPANAGGSAITSYTLQSSTDQSSWTNVGTPSALATTVTATGLTNGTLYYFRVLATNSNGSGPWSNSVSGIPLAVASAPTSVSGAAGNGQASVTWTAPSSNGGSAITDYVIQFSSNGGTSWTTFADGTGVPNPLSATVTGLTNGTSYVFRVAAVNSAGTGTYSTASSVVVPFTVSTAPTSVSGSPGNAQIPVTWTAPSSNGGSAIQDYIVQFSSNGGTSWTTFSDGTSASLSAIVTGLTNGTSYVFRVAAVNAAGTSAYSTVSSAVVPSAGGGSTGTFTLSTTENTGSMDSGSSSLTVSRAGTEGIDVRIKSGGNTICSVGQTASYDDNVGADIYLTSAMFLEFDTASIGGSVTSATLSIHVESDSSTVDFTIEAYAVDYGNSLTNTDWVNPTTLNAANILASLSTSALGTGNKVLTSNGNNLRNAINQSGKTRILLISSRCRINNSPTDGTGEYVSVRFGTTTALTVVSS